jgi:hypothetical protein
MQRQFHLGPSLLRDDLPPTPRTLRNLVHVLLVIFIKNVPSDVLNARLVERDFWKSIHLPSFANKLMLLVPPPLGNPPWDGHPAILPRGLADELQEHILSNWSLEAVTLPGQLDGLEHTRFSWHWKLPPGVQLDVYAIRIENAMVGCVEKKEDSVVCDVNSKASVPDLVNTRASSTLQIFWDTFGDGTPMTRRDLFGFYGTLWYQFTSPFF